jgi:hypothetical protein
MMERQLRLEHSLFLELSSSQEDLLKRQQYLLISHLQRHIQQITLRSL